jgi:hypothetical protein
MKTMVFRARFERIAAVTDYYDLRTQDHDSLSFQVYLF